MLGKQSIHEFKRGDFAKLKEGVKFPPLNRNINWEGRVMLVTEDGIKLALDSITLRALDNDIIHYYQEQDEYPRIVYLPKKDLEPSTARDSFEEMLAAHYELVERMDEGKEKEPYEEVVDKWFWHFELSDHYFDLSIEHQNNAIFLVDTFARYMYNYEGELPKKWTVAAAEETCLTWMPRKVSAEKATFEAYGVVLHSFFKFLDEEKYLKAKALQQLMLDIKDDIVIASQDSSNWGMAKSFAMGAVESGVDMSNQGALDDYLKLQQMRALSQLSQPASQEPSYPKLDAKRGLSAEEKKKRKKLKRLWGNQKINVRYLDGRVLNNVKYKEVKEDLLRGECELLEG